MKRYLGVGIIILVILAVTVSISAEFDYRCLISEIGTFTRKWATDWVIPLVTVLIAYLALRNIRIAHLTLQAFDSQLSILEKTHRVEILPLLEANLQMAPQLPDKKNSSMRLIDVSELKAWGDAFPDAADRFIIAQFMNLQTNPAGAAFHVQFRAVFKFPKHPSGTESIEIPRVFEGFWLLPKERWNIVMANLKGIPNATIDITEIKYYDNDGLEHRRAYGFCFIVVPQVGNPEQSLKVFAER